MNFNIMGNKTAFLLDIILFYNLKERSKGLYKSEFNYKNSGNGSENSKCLKIKL